MSGHIRSFLPAKRIFGNDNEAPSPVPPPPRFARCASSSGPPPPLSRGRMVRAISFSQRDPRRSYVPGEARIGKVRFAIHHPPLAFFFPQIRRGGRTPTDAEPTAALAHGARSAKRARLSAFHRGSHLREYLIPKARLQARLPGTWSERALPAFACPSPGMHLPSRSSCREADTQAAREQAANPPAGTVPTPPHGLPPVGVPW